MDSATIMIYPAKKGAKSAGKVKVTVRDGKLLKPVTALRAMMEQRRDARPDEPLFMYGGKPLSRSVVTRLVRVAMEAAGRTPRAYNSHGLRIGGATAALAGGVSPEAIQIMGRWDSDVYKIYCRQSRQVAMRLGAVIASTPFDDLHEAFDNEELLL